LGSKIPIPGADDIFEGTICDVRDVYSHPAIISIDGSGQLWISSKGQRRLDSSFVRAAWLMIGDISSLTYAMAFVARALTIRRSKINILVWHLSTGEGAMAYVLDFDFDVFVSYAHQDNEGESPWISTLVKHLEVETRQRLGAKDLRIWRDDRLDGNHPVTPEIMQAVRRAATLLVIMSPSYLASEWCSKERNVFLEFAQDRVLAGRVFMVGCRDTDRAVLPPEFRDLMGYKFWTQSRDAGGATHPLGWAGIKVDEYWPRLFNLSDNLAKKLREIRSQKPGSNLQDPARGVFLARSTDDMEGREEELVAYLTQAGLTIFPQTWYPEDSEQAYATAMQADLNQSSTFVQLLSKFPGRKTRFTGGMRFPVFQHKIAEAAGTTKLQWCEPDTDPTSIMDEEHRDLLERARSCGFEEFKRAVLETALRQPRQPKVRPSNLVVFVNADREDLAMARQLSELLAHEGVETYWPVIEGSPEKVRQDFEDNLKTCDGLVLIYGTSEPSWVRDQLRQSRKVLCQRERDLTALAIYLGPPPQKHELAVALPQLVTLDGRAGITSQSVRPFVERLGGGV
jgi:hypothetical protein